MKAFVFSDLHGSYKGLDHFSKYLTEHREIELIIFAGDLVNMGEPLGFVNKFIEIIRDINLPLMWVPGNNDFGRAYHRLNAAFKSLEGRVNNFGGRTFTGVGGSPASWAGQYAGEKMIDRRAIGGSIFVSHMPPPGILVMQKFDCQSPTSKNLSDSPLLHICGHLHNRWGCGYLGRTKVVNPGSLGDGRYAIIDLENLKVEFKSFNEGRL